MSMTKLRENNKSVHCKCVWFHTEVHKKNKNPWVHCALNDIKLVVPFPESYTALSNTATAAV